MDESKVHIDDLFRSKEQPFVALPAAAWDDMKLRLDQHQPKNGFLNRWIWYILLLLLLLLGTGFYLLSNHFSDQKDAGLLRTVPSSQSREISRIPVPKINKPKSGNRPIVSKATPANPRILGKSGRVTIRSRQLPTPALSGNRYEDLKSEKQMEPPAMVSAVPMNYPPEARLVHHLSSIGNPTPIMVPDPKPTATLFAVRTAVYPYLPPVPEHKNRIAPIAGNTAFSLTPGASAKSVDYRTETEVIKDNERRESKQNNPDPSLPSKSKKQLPIAYGVKAGYEAGISRPSVNKALLATFLQYRVGNFSIVLQPTVKYGSFIGRLSPNDKSYYLPTGTSVDSQTISKNGRPFWQITYTHSYDSITVKHQPAGHALEAEVPLILQYHLKDGIFFDAGLNLALGQLMAIEQQKQVAPKTQTAVFQIEKVGTHPPPDTSRSFHHSVPLYTASASTDPGATNPVRVGYLLGIGYEYRKWILEGYLQQNLYGLSGIAQPDIKKAYQAPYLHVMLGYRLSRK